MPSRVEIFAIYMGTHPLAQVNKPAQPLELPQALNDRLLRSIRGDLLKRSDGFCRTVRVAELPPLELEWLAAGQTAGVAVWSHRGNEPGKRLAGGASLLLTGLDDARERSDVLAAMAVRRLPVPPDINVKLDKDRRRPLVVNLFYHLSYFLDPLLATVAPMLGNTFFALLGTNIELKENQRE
jgi:hypothetical protein